MIPTIRALDVNGDFVFGQGLGSYATGQAAIIQDLQTSLLFFQNDCFWNTVFGVDWWNLLSQLGARKAQNTVLLQVRNVIAQTAGVVSIDSVDAILDSATRKLAIIYRITTIYGQVSGLVNPTS